jgi:hypothetical protein
VSSLPSLTTSLLALRLGDRALQAEAHAHAH